MLSVAGPEAGASPRLRTWQAGGRTPAAAGSAKTATPAYTKAEARSDAGGEVEKYFAVASRRRRVSASCFCKLDGNPKHRRDGPCFRFYRRGQRAPSFTG